MIKSTPLFERLFETYFQKKELFCIFKRQIFMLLSIKTLLPNWQKKHNSKHIEAGTASAIKEFQHPQSFPGCVFRVSRKFGCSKKSLPVKGIGFASKEILLGLIEFRSLSRSRNQDLFDCALPENKKKTLGRFFFSNDKTESHLRPTFDSYL